MNKRLLFVFIALSCMLSACGQPKRDYDKAVKQFQEYYNHQQFDNITDMLSERAKTLVPPEKLKVSLGQLYSQAGDLTSFELIKGDDDEMHQYRVVFKNVKLMLITSLNKDNKLESFRFVADDPASAAPKPTASNLHDGETFTLTTSTGNIYGTLTMPDTKAKVPVVLIIAGSGPTDRNGNNAGQLNTNTYKLIADTLKSAGIACLRYDKRGIGESIGAVTAEEKMTFDDLVADAAGFIAKLKEDPRFSSVIVAGHSEGSLIGIIAAQKGKVDKLVSMAGVGSPADEVLKWQLRTQPEPVKKAVYPMLDSLKKGFSLKHVDSAYYALFRPSVQPYLKVWFHYNPSTEIKKLKMPVMIVQGSRDNQVTEAEAKKLKAAYPSAVFAMYDGMDHPLKQRFGANNSEADTYHDPSIPLYPGFAAALVKFINK